MNSESFIVRGRPDALCEVSSANFRETMGHFATGITVVTTVDAQGKHFGMTATSFTSLSLKPPLVQWSLRNAARSFEIFTRSDVFAVNILAADQEETSRRFRRSRTSTARPAAFGRAPRSSSFAYGRHCVRPVRGTSGSVSNPADDPATATKVGSSSSGVADCRLSKRLAHDRPIRSARGSAPGRRRTPLAFDCQSAGTAPLTIKGWRLRPDALYVQQHPRRGGCRRVLCRSQQRVPCRFHCLGLLKKPVRAGPVHGRSGL